MAERSNTDPILSVADALLSRRQALTAAGAMAAAGVASAQSTVTAPTGASAVGMVGIAAAPANAVEFRAHFTQTGATGQNFEAFGYLTRVAGLSDTELFAGAPAGPGTALFSAVASGALVNRVHDGGFVHTLDVEGTLTVYQRSAPGATFDDPESFKVGTPVAQFAVSLQDVLTVIAPGKGLPSLNGVLRQTAAERLSSAPAARRFGRIGSNARMFATGLGELVDPVTLNSRLDMAGNWVIG
jgi:hypothetical protein